MSFNCFGRKLQGYKVCSLSQQLTVLMKWQILFAQIHDYLPENCVNVQEPDDLFETISQAMLNAVDRDAVSGMGVVVHVM